MRTTFIVMVLASLGRADGGVNAKAELHRLRSAGFSEPEISSRLNLARLEAEKTRGLPPRAIAAPPTAPVTQEYLESVGHRQPQAVYVKFKDGLKLRRRDDVMTDAGTGALRKLAAALPKGDWFPVHHIAEDRLDEHRAVAMNKLGRVVPDPNTEFIFLLEQDHDMALAINQLVAMEDVELAAPMPESVPMGAASAVVCEGDVSEAELEAGQSSYLGYGTGIGARNVWPLAGGTGNYVRIVDIEHSYNPSHPELASIVMDTAPCFAFDVEARNHGTSVLGILGASPGGMTGIAFGADIRFVSRSSWYTLCISDVASAVSRATDLLGPGDVMLIEVGIGGPYGSETCAGQVPAEWDWSTYQAIVRAVCKGICVVEGGGNGCQDLDQPIYSCDYPCRGWWDWWHEHKPFLTDPVTRVPVNDSGAIVVGAGYSATRIGGPVARAPISEFTNYGWRFNLQGPGENVLAPTETTCYRETFNGTSSASAVVAGACALLQSVYYARTGTYLTPWQVRDVLVSTGWPQADPGYHIGPLPNLPAAIMSLFPAAGDLDCQGNGVLDSIDINYTSFDHNTDGVPDECQLGTLSGTVTNAITSAPIVGAQVSVSGRTTVTNGSGSFSVTVGHLGIVSIMVSAPGYIYIIDNSVEIDALESLVKNFALTPSSGGVSGYIRSTLLDEPLERATVQVRDGSGRVAATTMSGTLGFYSVSGLPAGSYSIDVSMPCFDSQSQAVTINPADAVQRHFGLTGGAGAVSGIIKRFANDTVLSGAHVELLGTTFAATVGASGLFQFYGVPFGTYTLRASAPTFLFEERVIEVTSCTAPQFELFRLLPQPGQIQGTVTNEINGQPIGSATIRIRGGTTDRSCYSDVGGNYSTAPQGVPPGSVLVTATASGFASGTATVVVESSVTKTLNFSLAPPGSLAIYVYGSNGLPIGGVTVTTDKGQRGTTDGAGAVLFDPVAPGPCSVFASSEGWVPGTLNNVIVAPGQTTTTGMLLELIPSPGTIEGVVTDESQTPVEGARVSISSGRYSDTSAAGTYSLDDLPPEQYVVRVAAPGYASQKIEAVTVESDVVTTLNVALQVAGTISGVVVDHAGTPVTGARVYIPGTEHETTSGSGGAFSLQGLAPGAYAVFASHPPLREAALSNVVVQSGQITSISLTVLAPGRIEGHVYETTGSPIKGARVDVLGVRDSHVYTDVAGLFEVEGLYVGDYTLKFSAPNHLSQLQYDIAVTSGQVTSVQASLPVSTGVLYVRPGAAGTGTGINWTDAFTELQQALALAASGDQVWVSGGVYLPDFDVRLGVHTADRSASFSVPDGVAVYGGFAGSETSRDQRSPSGNPTLMSGDLLGNDGQAYYQDNSLHVVRSSATGLGTLIDGFTIKGGNADGPDVDSLGGGVLVEDSSQVSLSHCILTANRAESGAGLASVQGTPRMTDCIIRQNVAEEFGGGYFGKVGGAVFVGCSFLANQSSAGGALYCCENEAAKLINCVVNGNAASTAGGGLVANRTSGMELVSCVFSGNQASESGGLAVSEGASVRVVNCSISRNSSTNSGGGLSFPDLDTATTLPGAVTVINTILWGNSDASGNGESAQINPAGGQISIGYSCVEGWTGVLGGTGMLDDDPLFIDADGVDDITGTGDDDLRIAPQSGCIDAGDSSALPSDWYDLDSDGRTDEAVSRDLGSGRRLVDTQATPDTGVGPGPVVDMGAFEQPLDCDFNGLADAQEIEAAPGLDCNENGELDTCEVDSDGDDAIDECDVCWMSDQMAGFVWADVDQDGDVDRGDLSQLERCWSPYQAIAFDQCGCVDKNSDGRVDGVDFLAWQQCARGPGVAPGSCGE